MREVFHQSLEDVQGRLVEIAELVTVAIDKATRAFGTSDVALAEEVIEADAIIDEKAIASTSSPSRSSPASSPSRATCASS